MEGITYLVPLGIEVKKGWSVSGLFSLSLSLSLFTGLNLFCKITTDIKEGRLCVSCSVIAVVSVYRWHHIPCLS